ncbi:MAG: endonuclease domain-containing protein [Planctomycetes bacterium]|nr:endonuclease domain-containing protein [Planctomycetota bacterium]
MNKKYIQVARKLRKELTPAEKLVWQHLRRKQLLGLKFRRQAPIGKYIVDFACFEKRLVIEIDGGQHAEDIKEKDEERDEFLRQQGFKVFRFWNVDVYKNIRGVLESVVDYLSLPSP